MAERLEIASSNGIGVERIDPDGLQTTLEIRQALSPWQCGLQLIQGALHALIWVVLQAQDK